MCVCYVVPVCACGAMDTVWHQIVCSVHSRCVHITPYVKSAPILDHFNTEHTEEFQ